MRDPNPDMMARDFLRLFQYRRHQIDVADIANVLELAIKAERKACARIARNIMEASENEDRTAHTIALRIEARE